MTSNIGAEVIKKNSNIGFSYARDETDARQLSYERMKDKVLDEVKQFFRPEFLNRIDAQVVFHSLDRDHIRQIVDLMMKDGDTVRVDYVDEQVVVTTTGNGSAKQLDSGDDTEPPEAPEAPETVEVAG